MAPPPVDALVSPCLSDFVKTSGYQGMRVDGPEKPGIFGRRRVPKISKGLRIFIYCELWVGRGIPVDAPVCPVLLQIALVLSFVPLEVNHVCTH